MKPIAPSWSVPDDLADLVAADPAGVWEDDRWAPIGLTVMGGTSYRGRDIPLAWQVEFQTDDEAFEAPNEKLASRGVEPDGYGWSRLIRSVIATQHPEIAEELHFGDTELGSCVVWVESENTCKLLMDVVWSFIHNN